MGRQHGSCMSSCRTQAKHETGRCPCATQQHYTAQNQHVHSCLTTLHIPQRSMTHLKQSTSWLMVSALPSVWCRVHTPLYCQVAGTPASSTHPACVV